MTTAYKALLSLQPHLGLLSPGLCCSNPVPFFSFSSIPSSLTPAYLFCSLVLTVLPSPFAKLTPIDLNDLSSDVSSSDVSSSWAKHAQSRFPSIIFYLNHLFSFFIVPITTCIILFVCTILAGVFPG